MLYHEASGRIVVEDSGKLSTVPQNAAQNYLVADPLPDNVMLYTVNVVSEDCITLRNVEGKYLTNDKLAWTDTMEEGITTWRLNARNGAWQLLTAGDDRARALEIYKNNLSTYAAEPRDNFCFNFYEPVSRE